MIRRSEAGYTLKRKTLFSEKSEMVVFEVNGNTFEEITLRFSLLNPFIGKKLLQLLTIIDIYASKALFCPPADCLI